MRQTARERTIIETAGGNGTRDRLAECLERWRHGTAAFFITHSVEAPITTVWTMFPTPGQVARFR